ncbi:MAG: phenylalanine--tRNA ligase beta subunit-related protein [Armatimonadota bacterium]|nr:phenylalanine--tRNA ligase beta subunit-related protein [Armatimonadota bacterium]MDR5703042.1 phenylalanine--tRNA ligase beta subunit-related protein [Armatimonadota bacterium]
MVQITLEPALQGVVRLGVIEGEGLHIRDHDERMWKEIKRLAQRLKTLYAGREPSQVEALAPARELYKRVGMDPTRYRPSSEALLRRILKDQGLPQINTLVDVCTWCSLDFLLPIGLHDLDRIQGDLLLRRGVAGEGYEAIGRGWFSLEGKLTLADRLGPCGSPTSDSQRTMITLHTRRCLMVIYAPATYPMDRLSDHIRVAAERITAYNGGQIAGTALL